MSTKEGCKFNFVISIIWSSYSGTIKKILKNYNEIESIRGSRYFGPSQMSLLSLILHSFAIIAVFKYQVLLRSSVLIVLFFFLNDYLGFISIFSQLALIIFCITIFFVSLREKKEALLNSKENLNSIKDIAH